MVFKDNNLLPLFPIQNNSPGGYFGTGAGSGGYNDVGRLGHGLGMQLTEFPSNKAGDDTELVPGMVLTLEPGMAFAPGKMMVHEENIVIREHGAQWLTRRAPREMPVVGDAG